MRQNPFQQSVRILYGQHKCMYSTSCFANNIQNKKCYAALFTAVRPIQCHYAFRIYSTYGNISIQFQILDMLMTTYLLAVSHLESALYITLMLCIYKLFV